MLLQTDRATSATEALYANGSSPCSSNVPNTSRPLHQHARRWSDIPTRSALHNTVVFETKLKDKSEARKKGLFGSMQRGSKSNDNLVRTNSLVRFNTVVSGVEIPSRTQYSKRIKQSLWRDREELYEMVERNKEEFHYENYDWQRVVLDDDMYVNSSNGELVHPCHVQGYEDDSSSSSEEDVAAEEKKEEEPLVDDGFVPLGMQGKSTWEVL